MNAGILGLNIRQGVNNDNVTAYHRALLPYASLIHDEAKLIQPMLDAGTRVIWRLSGDDPAHNPLAQSPAEFVARRAAPLLDRRHTLIHLTNELGYSDAHDRWTLDALRVCESMGFKACIFNHATHTDFMTWMRSEQVLRAAVAGGHWIGAHVYWHGTFPDNVEDDAHSFLWARNALGGKWIITELGYAGRFANGQLDPETGWDGLIAEAEYARQLERAAAFYASQGIAACVFSYGRWRTYGVQDSAVITDALVRINSRYPVKGETTVPSTPVNPRAAHTALRMNIRAAPTTAAATVVTLDKGTPIIIFDLEPPVTVNGYHWLYVESGDYSGYMVTEVAGEPSYTTDAPSEEPPAGLTEARVQELIAAALDQQTAAITADVVNRLRTKLAEL